MKYLLFSVLVLQGASVRSFGGQPAGAFSHYKIQISFKDLDKKWLSGLQSHVPAQITTQDGTINLPSLTTRGGFPADLKIIQEYSVRLGGPIVPCGILFDLNPAFNGESIQVSGTSVLRYPTNKIDTHTATQFATQENLIDLTLKDGETKSINLDGGGEMLITVTLHDAKGERVSR